MTDRDRFMEDSRDPRGPRPETAQPAVRPSDTSDSADTASPDATITRETRPVESRPVPPMDNPKESRSLGSLFRELTTDTRDLVQQEVKLAKTEVTEKVDVLQKNMVALAIGGALLLAALLTLVGALSAALTSLFAQFMDLEIAVWLGPLVLAAILGLIGYSLIMKGKEKIQNEGMSLDRTADSLREDRRLIKEKAK